MFPIDQVVDECERALHVHSTLDIPDILYGKVGGELPKRKVCSVCALPARDDPCDECHSLLRDADVQNLFCMFCLGKPAGTTCKYCPR